MARKTGIIGDALAPNFNEALANQVRLLSSALQAEVLTANKLGLTPFKKMGKYLIVNSRFLRKRLSLLSLVSGAFFFLLLKLFEARFDRIFLTGGIDSQFLKYINPGKCILITNSMPFSAEDDRARVFVKKYAPQVRGVIVQSQRVKDKLIKAGVNPQKIRLVYPWVDMNKFRYTEPVDAGEIRLISASAPNLEDSFEDIFKAKGIGLLLEAFKEFARLRRASLCLVWRGHCNEMLTNKIKELDLKNQIIVINEVVDMPQLYAQSHITVVPFQNTRWSAEIPLSAVESLACGRPVVTTNVVEIASVIEKYKCGCIVEPRKEDITTGLVECAANYQLYQKNCRQPAEVLFGAGNIEEVFTL